MNAAILKIFIGDWGKHITTYEHQIHLQVRKRLLGFCWYGTPDIMPHEVKECQACQQRNNYIKNHVDLTEWDDYKQYDQEKDPEYMQYLEREKASHTAYATGRFSCIPCGIVNLSREYYEAHLLGKRHTILYTCRAARSKAVTVYIKINNQCKLGTCKLGTKSYIQGTSSEAGTCIASNVLIIYV